MTSRKNFTILALTAVLVLAVAVALPACSKNKAGNTPSSRYGTADTTGTMGAPGAGTRYGTADTTGTSSMTGAMTGARGAPGAMGTTGKSARGTRYGSEAVGGAGGVPGIKITSPKNGEMVTGTDLKVKVKVNNFKVVDKEGQPSTVGEGHIHYYLDVAPPTTPGQPAMPKSGTFAPAVNESHTFNDVKPGRHVIGVQLINNDHTPVQPAAIDTISVMVKGK